MKKQGAKVIQKTSPNDSAKLIRIDEGVSDSLRTWADAYFRFEVTTCEISQKEQRRDLGYFLGFMEAEEGSDERARWTPRLSVAFRQWLRDEVKGDGERRFSDRTVNRIMAHLKTFAKWVHKLRPFPLGSPMEKIRLLPVGSGLEVERAITPAERRKILDAADLLVEIGGRSKSRSRYRKGERPKRKGYRPYRNRAIVYALIETGMRRQAITKLNVEDVDIQKGTVTAEEKGGVTHRYHISAEGLEAILDYLRQERKQDFEKWQSPALFLSSATNPNGNGRLSAKTVNTVWNEVCRTAGVEGKTPHCARHAMGKHIIEKTGNIAAVQRQLGHRNAAYSMQYARITAGELQSAINDR